MQLTHVLVQVALLRKRAVAEQADVSLATRLRLVDVHVRSQIRAIGERFAATLEVALVRLLARVRAHVPLEQPRARECLATHHARLVTALEVEARVLDKCAVADEDLTTFATLVDAAAIEVDVVLVQILHCADKLWVGRKVGVDEVNTRLRNIQVIRVSCIMGKTIFRVSGKNNVIITSLLLTSSAFLIGEFVLKPCVDFFFLFLATASELGLRTASRSPCMFRDELLLLLLAFFCRPRATSVSAASFSNFSS